MIRAAVLPLAIALIALAAACGGGSEEVTPTPDLGLGGSFPRHLTGVTPEHGATVTNADLHVGETDVQMGICADFSFGGGDGMGDDPTSLVTLFVGGEEVTDSSTWVVTASQPPTGGSICYTPPQPYNGPIIANARWKETSDREFTYSWQFTVTD